MGVRSIGWCSTACSTLVSASAVIACSRLFFFFQAEDGIRDIGVTGVQTYALPISFFASQSVKPADRVLLASHNAPEWGISYFGVLKAGATCVPVDPESSTEELVNLDRKSVV